MNLETDKGVENYALRKLNEKEAQGQDWAIAYGIMRLVRVGEGIINSLERLGCNGATIQQFGVLEGIGVDLARIAEVMETRDPEPVDFGIQRIADAIEGELERQDSAREENRRNPF